MRAPAFVTNLPMALGTDAPSLPAAMPAPPPGGTYVPI